ncbi:MAG: NADH-quinone oxidoreductase subunit D [Deltaproteobacteria bacterium]|nr:NADH-quinone oxidoreductase subunit D [Deltaproteobacteria bacterium]
MLNKFTIDDATINQRTYQLNLGPQHPSTHGVMHFLLTLDGEVVVACEPIIGYSHRGHEKMAENRTYEQYLPNPARMDYLSGMIFNHGYCQAVEKLCGIEVPRRAEFIRVITSELNRIASHFIGAMDFVMGLGAITPFVYGWDDREQILDLLERIGGSRLTYSYGRFGGVRNDIDQEFYDGTRRFIDRLRGRLKDYHDLITGNIIFIKRSEKVGVITRETALEFGVTGPTLRGSGVKYDVRKNEPYSIYPEFKFEIPTREEGDCLARYLVRMAELEQSLNIIEQALDHLPPGPVRAKVPQFITPPEGDCYFAFESARGAVGFYIVSDGSRIPYRIKVRSPSFSNLFVMSKICPGHFLADVIAIFGSIDVTVPEIDR